LQAGQALQLGPAEEVKLPPLMLPLLQPALLLSGKVCFTREMLLG
jgi:hypothetical protein